MSSDNLYPSTFSIDLKKLVFSPGSPVKKLTLKRVPEPTLRDEISNRFMADPADQP